MSLNARAKKKVKDFILFDVVYEDGSRSSNRKVPADVLDDSHGDDSAKAFIEAQDNKIAETSGYRRGTIKTILRSK